MLILDRFHMGDSERGELTYDGFPTFKLAREFARRRVRDSLEELRKPDQNREELKRAWHAMGDNAVAIGGDKVGSDERSVFVDHPATSRERNWESIRRRAGPLQIGWGGGAGTGDQAE